MSMDRIQRKGNHPVPEGESLECSRGHCCKKYPYWVKRYLSSNGCFNSYSQPKMCKSYGRQVDKVDNERVSPLLPFLQLKSI